MPVIRVCFLWHMHQPFYKDLVTGEYRLPWVRMHALKDYYGMVKLLDEFPNVRQTFNLVPSLVTQIQDYVGGTARDPFYDVIAKPAEDLSHVERQFAVQYLFQINETNLVQRHPRYAQLLEDVRAATPGNQWRVATRWSTSDFADLQVLSQLAWFDEYWLDDPEVAALVRKGKAFDRSDQQLMLSKQREVLASVLPAYRDAAQKGSVEISTTPFYHPILPLLCDTNIGRVSSPEIALPRSRFRHPEDAAEQVKRALDFMDQTFATRPAGLWPSEGSVSNEALSMARQLGIEWMASDEGVLGRSINSYFERSGDGQLSPHSASDLYRIYKYNGEEAEMNLVFRDHSLSDLIGFVYAGADAKAAAEHFVRQIRSSAEPVLASGRDAVVSVILDGENAWEHFPGNGREFLRRLYSLLNEENRIEADTISGAIRKTAQQDFGHLNHITPGSWINANFNVWIGAPEDNRSWELLTAARTFYEQNCANASEAQRSLAYEELLISEGSDWNWWYGPEHHTANDSDFDELYRKHLANVYRALGADPPQELSVRIGALEKAPQVTPQTQFISPRMKGRGVSYFDWLGAASYIAPLQGAMHGGTQCFAAMQAGFDERFFYARLDFANGGIPQAGEILLEINSVDAERQSKSITRVHVVVEAAAVSRFWLSRAKGSGEEAPLTPDQFQESAARLTHVLEVRVQQAAVGVVSDGMLRLRFNLYENGLAVDALPRETWMSLRVLNKEDLQELVNKQW